jgi:hypothetical protein
MKGAYHGSQSNEDQDVARRQVQTVAGEVLHVDGQAR